MAPASWKIKYPLHIEQREKDRSGLMEEFITTTYNVLRKHDPELMEKTK